MVYKPRIRRDKQSCSGERGEALAAFMDQEPKMWTDRLAAVVKGLGTKVNSCAPVYDRGVMQQAEIILPGAKFWPPQGQHALIGTL